MADESAREVLSRQSRNDLATLLTDTWVERGWTVDGGTTGADLLANRENVYAERLAIVIVEPGQPIDVASIQRAAGIREQDDADVVLVVGTGEVTDAATTLARREALNVKVLDGWGLCRVLDEQGTLDRVTEARGNTGSDDGPAASSGGQGAADQRDAAGGTAEEPSTGEADGDTPAAAADNETPCPACGEAIFRPLIEQGLQCPYCNADFES